VSRVQRPHQNIIGHFGDDRDHETHISAPANRLVTSHKHAELNGPNVFFACPYVGFISHVLKSATAMANTARRPQLNNWHST